MEKGYIAITSAILLSFIMLILAVSVGMTSLLTRFGTLDLTSKQKSFFIARSCLEYARLELAQSGSYAGNETVPIDAYECTLLPIQDAGSTKIIQSTAIVNNATTNLQLTVNESDLSTAVFEELASF